MSANPRAVELSDHIIDGMDNSEYHKPEHGLSCSRIKDFINDPAALKWAESAEQDADKLAALDFGTDFHAYFLEPGKFKQQYQVLPTFNRRKPDEKQAELDLIAAWKEDGIISVTAEDMVKLEAMRHSAMAHPTVAAIMAANGVAERSFFWTDEATGVRCKCRPDWYAIDTLPAFVPDDCKALVADVKTIADISRIQAQIENLQYFVQDAFYTAGVEQVEGCKVCFAFIFVSTSLSLGRYPVQVVVLDAPAKFDGRTMVRDALADYAALSRLDDTAWQTAVTLDRPSWATRDDDAFA